WLTRSRTNPDVNRGSASSTNTKTTSVTRRNRVSTSARSASYDVVKYPPPRVAIYGVSRCECWGSPLGARRGAGSHRAPYGESWLALFERRLCRRNPILGEASEGAVAPEARLYGAPSEFDGGSRSSRPSELRRRGEPSRREGRPNAAVCAKTDVAITRAPALPSSRTSPTAGSTASRAGRGTARHRTTAHCRSGPTPPRRRRPGAQRE